MPTRRASTPANRANLPQIFQSVTKALVENQQSLDQSDTYNQNHGSNMVQTFQTITDALEKKKGSSDSAALAYAAKTLARQANSGSSQLYAEHLGSAARQFKGKTVDDRGALQLLQTLIGGSQAASAPASVQPPTTGGQEVSSDALLGALLGGAAGEQGASQGDSSSGGDLLGTLLGGMTGGQGASQGGSSSGGDLLSTLLGGMTGGQGASQGGSSSGGDLLSTLMGTSSQGESGQSGSSSAQELLGTLLGGMAGSGGGSQASGQQGQSESMLPGLLSAGLAFLQAKQSGKDNFQSLVQAILAGSGMGDSKHRTQSTEVVVESYLNALSGKQTR